MYYNIKYRGGVMGATDPLKVSWNRKNQKTWSVFMHRVIKISFSVIFNKETHHNFSSKKASALGRGSAPGPWGTFVPSNDLPWRCPCLTNNKEKPIDLCLVYTMIYISMLRTHNCWKWKSRFFTCPHHKISRIEAAGVSISNYTFKIAIFCEYVKFGTISWKNDILSITASF